MKLHESVKDARAIRGFDKIEGQFKEAHGDRYDYSKVSYINLDTNVEIVCETHGSFFQTPSTHRGRKDRRKNGTGKLRGSGCPYCAGRTKENNDRTKLTTYTFIEKAKAIHGEKYDYSLVNYVDSKTHIKIICDIHGEFEQSPNNHLKGYDCHRCGQIKKQVSSSNGRPNTLYLVRLFNNNKTYIKIGVTVEDLKLRFQGNEFEKICTIEDISAEEATLIEQEVLMSLPKELNENFLKRGGGYGEVYTETPSKLKAIMEILNKYKV